jgi:hypothetical protein
MAAGIGESAVAVIDNVGNQPELKALKWVTSPVVTGG